MKDSNDKDAIPTYNDFFLNFDIAKNTQMSIDTNDYVQNWQQQTKSTESVRIEVPIDKSDKKTSKFNDNFFLRSLQPCPFTFLTAVKQKNVISANNSQLKKTHDSDQVKQVPGGMDSLKPLKAPNLKISQKLDYSSRESLLSSEEFSKKIEEIQREEMSSKSTDKAPRKLEFSSSSTTSMLNYENIEPLKIPDFSISKKKDLSRDSSKEKENRSKRIKKDDFISFKTKDDFQDILNWPKEQRHISRKEIADATINKKLKNDRILAHGPIEDSNLKKSKTKNVVTSTVEKDEDKRQRCLNIPLAKSRKEKSLESRTSSSESIYPTDKGTRLHDKILIREGYKAMISEINDRKYKDDNHVSNPSKLSEDQKYKSHSEIRVTKHSSKSSAMKPIDFLSRDLNKHNSEKLKASTKIDSKYSSEISEDFTTAGSSIASLAKSIKSQSSICEVPSSIKNKDKEKFSQSSGRTVNEANYSDIYSIEASSNPVSSSTMIETKFSQDSSLSEKLMDPSRISFRDDSYSNQSEFVDLVAPDMSLTLRSKKRKQILLGMDDENDYKDTKKNLSQHDQDTEKTKTVQSKAEINLLDSFSDSFRQIIDVEKSNLTPDYRDSDSRKSESEFVETVNDTNKTKKSSVGVAEVQTQTANDIATQTDTTICQRGVNTSLVFSSILNNPHEISLSSMNSDDKYEDIDRVEDMSLPGKMRTLSEISLHETTSSIKTETGTEISVSTRDITCAFNKYLDLEMAQLIKDERQSNDKIEMLFKSREKILNDKTKKLVKLEEQKRALRDTGQESRVSSVKKKQRALLLKLQQEKDEMNRLKELHKIASQERKLMLQKQRDMFNPEMSTKNFLNKLKRSADNQSPRRLSGPMKGYDIRSNSSISSLIDSDKSQLDRSQLEFKHNLSDSTSLKNQSVYPRLEVDSSLKQESPATNNSDRKVSKTETSKQQKDLSVSKMKYDLKTRKFEDKMPKSDVTKLKSQYYDLDSILKRGVASVNLVRNDHRVSLSQEENDKSISEHIKSESDALIEEFTQIWKSQFSDHNSEILNVLEAPETKEALKNFQKVSSSRRLDKESLKRLEQHHDVKNAKRKSVKNQKSKLSPAELTTKSSEAPQYIEEAFRHHIKRSKIDNEQQSDDNYQNSMLEELDFNESQSSLQALLKHSNLLKERNQKLLQDIVDERNNIAGDNSESPLSQKEEELRRIGNTSARSQLSLTISHQSSNDSDRSYSRSVVIRSQQDHQSHTGLKTSKKLEQILRAREATLVSRRNCVEEWISWHARLKEEENRVARMEQAAYKLVSATAKALSHNDTTISSDTSDVEGRIELLTQKLADRRLEMTRLKKEARKQAKQRLKALEANLLNQIKRYDSTIRDMRKKLETKKVSSKENDKLAIESRSLVDFKVPEIPVKKIKEIYKNSDLLRSKSDSDVITAITESNVEKSKVKSKDSEVDSIRSRSSVDSKPASSLYTVYDEEQETSEKSDYRVLNLNQTKSNSEDIVMQKSIITEIQDTRRSSSQSSNISEDIPSESYSVKSQIESVQTAKTSETAESQNISEKINYDIYNEISKKDLTDVAYIEEELSPAADDTSIIFSRKLDHIQLNNKELNDNIHNLENDIKKLTEMMSNFSKKSENENVKSIDNAEETSEDIQNSILKDITKESVGSTEVSKPLVIDKDLQARVQKILSDVVPETDDLLTSIEELNNKSTLIEANTLEKSIETETTNKLSTAEEILTDLPFTVVKDKTSNSFNHESEINYISEIVTTIIEDDKENLPSHETSESTKENFEKQINSELKKSSSNQESNDIDSTLVKQSKTTCASPSEMDTNSRSDKILIPVENEAVQSKITEESGIKINSQEIYENQLSTSNEEKYEDQKDVIAKEIVTESFKGNNLNKTSESDHNWTLSDSFEIQCIEDKDSVHIHLQLEHSEHNLPEKDDNVEQKEDHNGISDMEDSTMFIPKGESTNLPEEFILKLDDSSDHPIGIRSDEFNDILEIIERETKIDDESHPSPAILQLENHHLPKVDLKIDAPLECDVSITVAKTVNEESESIEEEIEDKTESASESLVYNEDLPQIEIGLKIQLINNDENKENEDSFQKHHEIEITEIREFEGDQDERGSSEGEQMDNLVEVAEGKLDTVEKLTESFEEKSNKESALVKPKTHVQVFLDRTFEVIKDPGYEDISEESLEVSGLIDKTLSTPSKKFSTIPEKYVIKSKPDEVLSILDEISNKSNNNFKEQNRDITSQNDRNGDLGIISQDILKEKEEPLISSSEKPSNFESVNLKSSNVVEPISVEEVPELNLSLEDSKPAVPNIPVQEVSPRAHSDSSEGTNLDTPGGISEIDMDSPRDIYDNSRLDVDALDDDLLSSNLLQSPINEAKTEFRTTPMGVTSEKDIEAAINNLKASLEQPGLEVAELEAKLLQIENLQIELEIKKLEAEEVSYYVREIPNKPPPPYTPPGAAVRLSSSQGSPSPPPVVIPTNVEELTAVTEKATAIIYSAKQLGEDILQLEAPSEICEIAKDKNDDSLKLNRKIYNTFLFDLCKELVVEMYKTDNEKPGPSWTKPNVKTKSAIKIAKTSDELNEYVSKEVATLFGFKTKLQRENMVMRWSRKRRDRVDELLAKEAQAEEKEWTKFHHDELAVKNELTATILDTLILETTNCLKAAYAKKHRNC